MRDYQAFAAGTKTLSDVAAWNTMRVTVGHEESSIPWDACDLQLFPRVRTSEAGAGASVQ